MLLLFFSIRYFIKKRSDERKASRIDVAGFSKTALPTLIP
jgi:hypothetical protein